MSVPTRRWIRGGFGGAAIGAQVDVAPKGAKLGMKVRSIIAALLAAGAVGVAAKDLWQVQDFVVTVGRVDGAPLKVYEDRVRRTHCYFWKSSLSCVRE